MVKTIFVNLCFAALIAEGTTYVWHRWVTHSGVMRTVWNDAFRRRHFTHHMRNYPPKRLASLIYEFSCDRAFHPMGCGVFLLLTALAWTNLISWMSYATLVVGGVIYARYCLGGVAVLYHLDESVVRNMFLFRFNSAWRIYVWLRDYHLVHHFIDKNFAMILPIFDILGGSYVSPRELPKLRQDKSRWQNTFPEFNPELASTCGGPGL